MPHVHELNGRRAPMQVRAVDAAHQPQSPEAWLKLLSGTAAGELCLIRSADDCLPLLSDSIAHASLGEACREKGVHAAWSYKESCTGRQYRALTFVDDKGSALANYRCTHPDAVDLDGGSSPGNWMTIVPWAVGRVGLLLGNDLDHPEVARALRLGGAELLLWMGRTSGGPGHWRLLSQARAIENGVPWLGFGQDLVLALPDGSIHAAAGASVTLDLGRIAGPSGSKRRPILYRRLSEEEPVPRG